MAGKVWLVGAGPSDPGLFTRKGEQVLRGADVIVYDALVGQGVLAMMPAAAKKIYVGKRSGNHAMPQEEINRVLAEEAKKGNNVVRLKGGDPFLFGRGGEELELLVQEGIPFEVVPGVTSAISVPAYNGIPVTHRDFCSSLHIITGHRRKNETYDIDFEALVRTKGTLVFLMGAAALEDLCEGLRAAGMDGRMPAAVLQRGTTAKQKRIVATVETLPEEVKKRGVETPAIIVVGEVCALEQQFAWYEKLPLAGNRILVTRPRELISKMSEKLRAAGAEVLEYPAIRIEARECTGEIEAELKNLHTYDWLVFTSPSGVRIFFEDLKALRMDIRVLAGVKIAVLGGGTAKALEEYGCYADLQPKEFYAKDLGTALKETLSGKERVLIFRAAAGSEELTQELGKAECVQICDLAAYDTVYETPEMFDPASEFEDGVDYAVFTSASTVRGFAQTARGLDFTKVNAVCIGRKTKEAADALGMKTFMAKVPSMDAVVEKLCELAAAGKSSD